MLGLMFCCCRLKIPNEFLIRGSTVSFFLEPPKLCSWSFLDVSFPGMPAEGISRVCFPTENDPLLLIPQKLILVLNSEDFCPFNVVKKNPSLLPPDTLR